MEKLNSVQMLRALAALMVTVAHASEEAKFFFGFEPLIDTTPLGKGVDLFFVISGFIIYYSSLKLFQKENALAIFSYNRFSRVVPLYFLFTTLMVFVVVFMPSGVKEARFDIMQIVSSYTFIPYERYDGRIAPILSLGWTLNYEIFFYCLFSLMIWMPPRRAAMSIIAILGGLSVVGLFLDAATPAALRFWTHNIILEFALGVGVGVAYERWGKRFAVSTLAALALGVGGMAALYALNLPDMFVNKPPRILTAGVPAACMIVAAVMLLPQNWEKGLPRWISALGDSSYSLYLSHRFVQRPIQIVLTRAPIDPAVLGPIYLFTAVIAAVIVGHIIYIVIETPLLRTMRKVAWAKVSPEQGVQTSRATKGFKL